MVSAKARTPWPACWGKSSGRSEGTLRGHSVDYLRLKMRLPHLDHPGERINSFHNPHMDNDEGTPEQRGGLRECGPSEFASCNTRSSRTDYHDKELRRCEARVTTTRSGGQATVEMATWNIGGGSEEKCQNFLPGFIDSHQRLRRVHFLLIQEATQKNTIAAPTMLKDWTLALFKSEAEWRGQGIMVRKQWGALTQLQGMPGVYLQW